MRRRRSRTRTRPEPGRPRPARALSHRAHGNADRASPDGALDDHGLREPGLPRVRGCVPKPVQHPDRALEGRAGIRAASPCHGAVHPPPGQVRSITRAGTARQARVRSLVQPDARAGLALQSGRRRVDARHRAGGRGAGLSRQGPARHPAAQAGLQPPGAVPRRRFAAPRAIRQARTGRGTLDAVLAAGERALLFTQFTEWADRLVPYLRGRFGREVLYLSGSTARRERDAMVDASPAARCRSSSSR